MEKTESRDGEGEERENAARAPLERSVKRSTTGTERYGRDWKTEERDEETGEGVSAVYRGRNRKGRRPNESESGRNALRGNARRGKGEVELRGGIFSFFF